MQRDSFLPPIFILKNAAGLSQFPASIIHGRYDLVCRRIEACQLHERIEGSRLTMVPAGHSASEPAIKRAVRPELRRMALNFTGLQLF